MKCPACSSELIVIELDQIEIDHCQSCKGIWLDAIEMEMLFEDRNQKDKWFESFEKASSVVERKRKCPICDHSMDKVHFIANGDKILLDQCRKRDGVWCDHGELQRMVLAKHSESGERVLKLLQGIFVK